MTTEAVDIPTGAPRFDTARPFFAHPLVLLPIGFVLVVAGAVLPVIAWNLFQPQGPGFMRTLVGLSSGFGALAAYFAFRRWIDPAPGARVDGGRTATELGFGILIGVAIFCIVTAIAAVLGGFRIIGTRGWGDIWLWLGIALSSGMAEEAVFRGVIQRKLEAMFGTWAALVATSAFFGLAHLMNPGATMFAAFAIACEAGVMLGAAYLLTRRLWLPIGIHMGWNFTQGWVFSIPVSGSPPPKGLLETQLTGPEWLTGGAFGLEASFIALVVATGLGIAFLVLAHRKGEFRPPRWRRSPAEIAQTNE